MDGRSQSKQTGQQWTSDRRPIKGWTDERERMHGDYREYGIRPSGIMGILGSSMSGDKAGWRDRWMDKGTARWTEWIIKWTGAKDGTIQSFVRGIHVAPLRTNQGALWTRLRDFSAQAAQNRIGNINEDLTSLGLTQCWSIETDNRTRTMDIVY